MTILFLTGGLEPGKDGVGDYTRLLAVECIRRKQICFVIALNDPHVSQPLESIELIDGIPLPTLRLPARLPWKKRVELAAAFRTRQPLDWISLQFVPYAFNRKGIVRNLPRHLEPIIAGCAVHIMFHETWIGAGKSSSVKDRIVGKIQRHYDRVLFRRLAPSVVTTSNPFYVSMLKSIAIIATETPLFGNIPICSGALKIPEPLLRPGICDTNGSHKNHWLGLFFGALYPEWKAEPCLGLLASAPEKAGKRVCLVSAGKQGAIGEAIWKKAQHNYAHAIDFIVLGECPVDQISALMQIADFGLATTPWHLIGKSGAAAAMLDHGLPVIVTNFDFLPPSLSSQPDDPLLHRCDASLETKLWSGLPKRPARHRVGDAAGTLINLLAKLNSTS